MPENHLAQYTLSINIGSAFKLERVIDGRLQKEQFIPGNIAIYPAKVDYVLRWERESEFLLLGIDPMLLARTATEVLEKEAIELVPILSTLDPLIHSLALALKAELESPQVGGKLYVETIAQTLTVHLLRNYTTNQSAICTSTSPSLPKHKLQQAIDYINDYLDRDLSLSDLAALVQMSPFH